MSGNVDLDRVLKLINERDFASLKKEDYDQFMYQGFDPYRLLSALVKMKDQKSISDSAFSDDIFRMVAIGLIKGNVNEHNMTKMSDAGQKDLKDLMTKYNITSGGGKGKPAEAITFPRVMATFPQIAVRMTTIVGGKIFRGGPFGSDVLPLPMQIQVFPSVVPTHLNDPVKQFILTACLCYSVDQTIQISRIDKPNLKTLCDSQESFVLIGHNSVVPSRDIRIQTFNQMGLPSTYDQIRSVVEKYKEKVKPDFVIPSEIDFKQALAII